MIEKYKPSKEEIQKAEEIMTDEQKKMSAERGATFLAGKDVGEVERKQTSWENFFGEVTEIRDQITQHNKELASKEARGETLVKNEVYWTEMDPGIEELLTALHAHGFNTVDSCKGHPERTLRVSSGFSKPVVSFWAPRVSFGDKKWTDLWGEIAHKSVENSYKETEEIKKLRQKLDTTILHTFFQLRGLLDEFYKIRENIPADARLTIEELAYARSRGVGPILRNEGGDEMIKDWADLSDEEIQERIKGYQKEMSDFTEFLKDKFFKR